MTTVKVRIHDLSLGGCLVEAPVPVRIGRRVTLRLDLPGDGRLSLEGETVRAQERCRVAVKFYLSENDEGRLQQVIERLSDTGPAESTLDEDTDA